MNEIVLDPDGTDEGESYSDGDLALEDMTEDELGKLVVLQSQIDDINAIEDDDERLEAARAWAEELRG